MPEGHTYDLEFEGMTKIYASCSCGWTKRVSPPRDDPRELWRNHLRKVNAVVNHDDFVYFNNQRGEIMVRCCDCGWETFPTKDSQVVSRQLERHQQFSREQ